MDVRSRAIYTRHPQKIDRKMPCTSRHNGLTFKDEIFTKTPLYYSDNHIKI